MGTVGCMAHSMVMRDPAQTRRRASITAILNIVILFGILLLYVLTGTRLITSLRCSLEINKEQTVCKTTIETGVTVDDLEPNSEKNGR